MPITFSPSPTPSMYFVKPKVQDIQFIITAYKTEKTFKYIGEAATTALN